MKLIKGDNILVVSGKDKGKTGKIMRSLPKVQRILVEGVNLKKKHIRPKKDGEKGQVVAIPMPFDVSNVKLICPKCGKATRVGYQVTNKEKTRICKKCDSAI